MDIRQALANATQALSKTSDSARLDAELLLAHCLQKTRTYLFTWPEKNLTAAQSECFNALLTQRLTGHPIAHLTGTREFWGLELQVTPDTLIPRPDTELLVEIALAHLEKKADEQTGKKAQQSLLDLGTGTGAIALAIASEHPHLHITATDIDAATLAVAQRNAAQHHCNTIRFLQSDWFQALATLPDNDRFDMIVSNPPYIANDDPHLQQGDVRFEPDRALTSGDDGLHDIRHLIQNAKSHLKTGGWLFIEHGYDQGDAVTTLLRQAEYTQVQCHQDLAGNDRVSGGQL